MKKFQPFLVLSTWFASTRPRRMAGYEAILGGTLLLASIACGNVGIELGGNTAGRSNANETFAGAGGFSKKEKPVELRDAGADAGWDTGVRSSETADSGPNMLAERGDSGAPEPVSCAPNCSCEAGGNCAFVCRSESCGVQCVSQSNCEVAVGEALRVELQCATDARCRAGGSTEDPVEYICRGGGECIAECQGARVCSLSCVGATTCELRCGQSERCSVDCGEDASCLLRRDIETTDTAVSCGDDSIETSCPDSDYVGCDAVCPVGAQPGTML